MARCLACIRIREGGREGTRAASNSFEHGGALLNMHANGLKIGCYSRILLLSLLRILLAPLVSLLQVLAPFFTGQCRWIAQPFLVRPTGALELSLQPWINVVCLFDFPLLCPSFFSFLGVSRGRVFGVWVAAVASAAEEQHCLRRVGRHRERREEKRTRARIDDQARTPGIASRLDWRPSSHPSHPRPPFSQFEVHPRRPERAAGRKRQTTTRLPRRTIFGGGRRACGIRLSRDSSSVAALHWPSSLRSASLHLPQRRLQLRVSVGHADAGASSAGPVVARVEPGELAFIVAGSSSAGSASGVGFVSVSGGAGGSARTGGSGEPRRPQARRRREAHGAQTDTGRAARRLHRNHGGQHQRDSTTHTNAQVPPTEGPRRTKWGPTRGMARMRMVMVAG